GVAEAFHHYPGGHVHRLAPGVLQWTVAGGQVARPAGEEGTDKAKLPKPAPAPVHLLCTVDCAVAGDENAAVNGHHQPTPDADPHRLLFIVTPARGRDFRQGIASAGRLG